MMAVIIRILQVVGAVFVLAGFVYMKYRQQKSIKDATDYKSGIQTIFTMTGDARRLSQS